MIKKLHGFLELETPEPQGLFIAPCLMAYGTGPYCLSKRDFSTVRCDPLGCGAVWYCTGVVTNVSERPIASFFRVEIE